MNNFNKVFLIIKKHCEKEKRIAEINCFDVVAREANIPFDKLAVYLNHLQDVGVISYSIAGKYIYLTSFGRKQQSLIKDEIP